VKFAKYVFAAYSSPLCGKSVARRKTQKRRVRRRIVAPKRSRDEATEEADAPNKNR
jgi:hypothetical protein